MKSCDLCLIKSNLCIADKCSWLQWNLKTFQLHHFDDDRVLYRITSGFDNVITTSQVIHFFILICSPSKKYYERKMLKIPPKLFKAASFRSNFFVPFKTGLHSTFFWHCQLPWKISLSAVSYKKFWWEPGNEWIKNKT